MFEKGYKQTEQQKSKIGLALKGRPKSPEHRAKMHTFPKGGVPWNKGLKGALVHTEDTRKRMSATHKSRKELSHLWKGGITPKNKLIRQSVEYKLWREAVFQRDNWTCIWCGDRGVRLNADHIKPFSLFPELRFSIDNGRTLCVPCHKTTDTYLYKLRPVSTK